MELNLTATTLAPTHNRKTVWYFDEIKVIKNGNINNNNNNDDDNNKTSTIKSKATTTTTSFQIYVECKTEIQRFRTKGGEDDEVLQ